MLAHSDEVWVLTRSNNRGPIESESASRRPGLHFVYYDLPLWVLKLKKQAWFFYVYLVLWQWGAYRCAARLHRGTPFDRVYHVTFAGMLSGSFMGRLGIPFVVGPIAGGERAPFPLRRSMPLSRQFYELLRDAGILLQRFSPLARSAFASARQIFVTTPQSLRLVAPKWRHKTRVQLAVAIESRSRGNPLRKSANFPRFVFAGNLFHLKGVHLAIKALAETRDSLPGATLTLIGDGRDDRWLREMASRYGVADSVHFIGRLPRQLLLDSMSEYTALVFPSLHDSGGFVVLEALAAGLPVICLDLGGPGIMINDFCGIVVSTSGAAEAQVVNGIAKAMISIASMPAAGMEALSTGALARAKELSWTNLTACIMGDPGRGAAMQSGEAAKTEPSRDAGIDGWKRTGK